MDTGDACHGDNANLAIACYTAALQRDPKLAAAYFGRGKIYHEASEYGRAIADYDEAARLDPSKPAVPGERGLCHQALGHMTEAVADFEEALRLGAPESQKFQDLIAATQDLAAKGDRPSSVS